MIKYCEHLCLENSILIIFTVMKSVDVCHQSALKENVSVRVQE